MLGLRNQIKARRLGLSIDTVASESHRVLSQLLPLVVRLGIQSIAIYFPIQNEINVVSCYPDLELNEIAIFAPKFISDTVGYSVAPWAGPYGTITVQGRFDVAEPSASPIDIMDAKSAIEAWVVPGLVFGKNGGRLGFGNGYFDRLLAQSMGIKIGIGYNFQLFDHIALKPNDVPMDYVITPSTTHRCRQ